MMSDNEHSESHAENTSVEGNSHELLKLNKRIKMMMNGAFSYAILLDCDAKVLQFSDNLLSLLGITDGRELIGVSLMSIYNELFENKDFVKGAVGRLSRIMSGEDDFYEDDTVFWPTGEKRMYRITYKRLFDEDNNYDGVLIYSQDLTNLRLEEAQRRVKDLLRSSKVPCVIWDEKGDVVEYNDATVNTFGTPSNLTPAEFNKFFLSIQPEYQADGSLTEVVRQGLIREALEKGFSQIAGHLEKSDGTPFPVSVNVTRVSWLYDYRLVVHINDLTEIRAKEVAAKEAEERMKLMLDSNPLCCSFWDENHNMIDCNEEAARVFNLSDKQVFLDDFLKLSPTYQPDGQLSKDKAKYVLNEAFEKGRIVFEWMHQNLNGEPIPAEVTLVRMQRDGHSILAGYTVLGYLRDLREHKRMMAETEEANKRTKLMLDINPMICIMRDDKGNIIDCNQEALNVLGIRDKTEFCKNFYSYFPEYQPNGQYSTEITKELERILAEKGIMYIERTFLTPAGELVPVETKFVRIPWQETFRDISFSRDLRETKANEKKMQEIAEREREAQIQREEALDRFKVIWEHVECGITVVDAETREIVDMNPVAVRMFGGDKTEIIGKRCHNFICPAKENACPIIDMEQTIDRSEKKFIKADGTVIPIIKSVAKIYSNGRLMLLESFTDITSLKEAEEQLRNMEIIEQANRAKSAFLARMSHEIRTPMNSIIGFSELALDDNISPKTKDYLNQIMENSSWLLQIINDLLDISKIESGRMEIESIPFNLNDVFSYCKSAVAHRALRKNISLVIDAQTNFNKNLIGDPSRLRQVLLNLLTNALKFTEVGSVQLMHKIIESTEHSVTLHFEVKDTGIGIMPDQIEKIFEPFSQADVSITRKYGGTGLGLPITMNILELMGSKLEVESILGAGSIFSFELTFETTDISDETYRIKNADLGIKKPTFTGVVLVCEDNRMNQRVITEHLERVGLTVEIAETGQEGIDKVQKRIDNCEKPFDLIFMDVHMPVMDGLQATPIIMKMGTGTPIVAMTANIMTGDVDQYKMLGMNDHIGKPFRSQELWRCLLKYLTPIDFQNMGVSEDKEDTKLQKQLKADFVKDNQTKFDEIKNAVDVGDIKLAHRLAHTLKSNAGLIGKSKLQKIAADVEESLKGGENQATEEQMNILRFELCAALDEMASYHEKATAGRSATGATAEYDAEKARELIEKLEPLLRSGNPECLNLVDDLRSIPGSEELIQQIEDFYFSAASELLNQLKEKL